MGIAIIKGEFGANALGRTMHNLTPKDSNRRKSFTNNDLKNTRWEEVNGVYKVAYINLGQATQHYKYVLCDSQGNELQSQIGVSINQISGDITLDSNYDGSAVYAKVVPIIDNYYSVAINTTAVLVIDESEYTLDFAYNNSQGINARPQQVSMTSFTISEDGVVVTSDKSELSNASVVVKENTNVIFSSNDITASLVIPGNTSSTYRDLIVTIQGTYNGVPLSKSFVLPQGADAIDTIGIISYSGSLIKGTTLDPNDFKTMATYLSGKTPFQLHGISVNPNTIQNSTATYTVTFEGNRSGQIELIPEDSQVITKTYISGFPTDTGPREADGPYPSPTQGTHNWPLWVEVTHSDSNLGVENMTYDQYLALNEEKENYSSPVVVIAHTSTASVGQNGTLTYDFSGSNYAYDSPDTKISSITINHESDSSKNKSISNITINADRFDTTYFSNFTSEPLVQVSGVEVLSGYHDSQSSNDSQVVIDTDSASHNGVIYKLPSSQDYYIHAPGTGGSYSIAIISLPSGQSVTNTTYVVDNVNIKWVPVDSSTRNIYIHHTPTSGYTTYLVMNLTFASTLYLLTE